MRHRMPRASYPEPARAAPWVPYLDLLRTGFSEPPCHHDAGALLPHLFTIARRNGLCIFCATFRRITPPSRYEASCPVEPGLSSMRPKPHRDRSARLLCQYRLSAEGESNKWKMENGKWRTENGEWRMENGEWSMEGRSQDIGNGRSPYFSRPPAPRPQTPDPSVSLFHTSSI